MDSGSRPDLAGGRPGAQETKNFRIKSTILASQKMHY